MVSIVPNIFESVLFQLVDLNVRKRIGLTSVNILLSECQMEIFIVTLDPKSLFWISSEFVYV